MGTRCQIVKLDSRGKLYPARIYKHGGDLDVVLPTLVPFAAAFWKEFEEHPNDASPGRFLAQLLFAFDQAERPIFAENARRSGWSHGAFGGPEGDFCGYDLGTLWHGDIDYLYVVGSPRIVVFKVPVGALRGVPHEELPVVGLKRVGAKRIARILREEDAASQAPAAPQFCDRCIQFGNDLDNPLKHPPEECPKRRAVPR